MVSHWGGNVLSSLLAVAIVLALLVAVVYVRQKRVPSFMRTIIVNVSLASFFKASLQLMKLLLLSGRE